MKRFWILAVFLWVFSLLVKPVNASFDRAGLAVSVDLGMKNLKVGTIVSYSQYGYEIAKQEYDPDLFGVVAEKAAIAIQQQNNVTSYLVTSNGNTRVRVSAKNGPIKKGDWITSSTTPGVGVKATHSGYVLGSALANFNPKNKEEVVLMPVALSIRYVAPKSIFRANFLDVFNLSRLATYEQPLTVFKYLIAAVLILLSVVGGFLIFGRVSVLGVQALGRNPLASHKIQFGILMNALITITIIVVSLVLALTIIK